MSHGLLSVPRTRWASKRSRKQRTSQCRRFRLYSTTNAESARRRVDECLRSPQRRTTWPPRNRALPGERRGNIRFLKVTKHGHVLNDSHRVFIADYIEGLAQGCKEADFHLQVSEHRVTDLGRFTRPVGGVVGERVRGARHRARRRRPGAAGARLFPRRGHRRLLRLPEAGLRGHGQRRSPAPGGRALSAARTHGHRLHKGDDGIGTWPCAKTLSWLRSSATGSRRGRTRFLRPTVHTTVPTAMCSRTFKAEDGCLRPCSPETTSPGDGCVKALREHGVRVPEDVSVIGFDDLPSSSVVDPPLTTVRVHKQQIGRTGRFLLSHRIDEPGAATVKVRSAGNW